MSEKHPLVGGSAAARQTQIGELLAGAQTAIVAHDWPLAAERLQQVLLLEPAHAEATARLEFVRAHAPGSIPPAQGPPASAHGVPRVVWILLIAAVLAGALAAIAAGVWIAS